MDGWMDCREQLIGVFMGVGDFQVPLPNESFAVINAQKCIKTHPKSIETPKSKSLHPKDSGSVPGTGLQFVVFFVLVIFFI